MATTNALKMKTSALTGSVGDNRAKVRVIARTRPTANFPHSNIQVEEDAKV